MMTTGLPLGNVGGGKYDNALMGILQDCVKLPVFLDSVFSFLARRTDFYIIMKQDDSSAKMGFLEREAEAMVMSVSYDHLICRLHYILVAKCLFSCLVGVQEVRVADSQA